MMNVCEIMTRDANCQQVHLRIQVLVVPHTGRQLPNNPWIQDQVVNEALVAWDTFKKKRFKKVLFM